MVIKTFLSVIIPHIQIAVLPLRIKSKVSVNAADPECILFSKIDIKVRTAVLFLPQPALIIIRSTECEPAAPALTGKDSRGLNFDNYCK